MYYKGSVAVNEDFPGPVRGEHGRPTPGPGKFAVPTPTSGARDIEPCELNLHLLLGVWTGPHTSEF